LERHDDADPKLREKWEEELEAAVESEYRRQRTELLSALQWWVRDVWLLTFLSGSDLLALPHLVEFSKSVASRLKPSESMDNLKVLEQLQSWLGTNAQEALALEVGLLRLKL
jgi:DNA polymerase-3 subunit delta'